MIVHLLSKYLLVSYCTVFIYIYSTVLCCAGNHGEWLHSDRYGMDLIYKQRVSNHGFESGILPHNVVHNLIILSILQCEKTWIKLFSVFRSMVEAPMWDRPRQLGSLVTSQNWAPQISGLQIWRRKGWDVRSFLLHNKTKNVPLKPLTTPFLLVSVKKVLLMAIKVFNYCF